MNTKFQGGANLLSTAEAAALLRTSNETVIGLAKAGQIDGFKIGRNWRIRRDSIEAFIHATSTQARR